LIQEQIEYYEFLNRNHLKSKVLDLIIEEACSCRDKEAMQKIREILSSSIGTNSF